MLILIMTAVSGSIGLAAVGLLYHAAFEEERQRLVEIAKSHARLIEAVARFNETYSRHYPKGPREATLSQIQDAHAVYEGFGRTGEFTLAERQADSIQFILSFRHAEIDLPKRIPLQSNLAEPMRRALAGHSGTLVGLDYRGMTVLAAHEPVALLDLGIVAKLDLAEIRAPFLRAGSIVGGTAIVLIAAGTFLFFRVSKPILQHIADSEERFRSISTAAQDAIIMMDSRGKVSFWNKTAERIFGHKSHEASGQALSDLIIPRRYHQRHLAGAEHFLRTGQGLLINRTVELEAERKDGTEFPVEISISGVLLGGKWNAIGILRDITDRKKAERKAQEKQSLLEQIIENIPYSIFWKDRNSVYLGCNRNFARQAGVEKPEDIIGKTDYELAWKQSEAEFFRKIDREVIESGQPRLDIEEPQLQANETQATLLTSKVPLANSRGNIIGILGIYADITSRKLAEEELKQREDLLRLILASTGEGIFGIDPHGRCTFANRACAEILGYKDATELFGKEMHTLIHHTRLDGTPYPREECPTHDAFKYGKTTRVEGEVLWRADGSFFPADYECYPLVRGTSAISAVVSFTDITERKRAEEALRRERDFAESLIETAQVIVLVLDTEGRIARFNRFMEQLSGYRLEDVRGRDWFNTFLPEQDREQFQQVFQKALSDIPTIGQINPIITHSGQQRLIEWYDKTLKNVDGQVIGVLAIGHDITEHKAQEAQLLQAQKMEVVGQLTGGIAHDFNNLLTIILGNLDFLSTEFNKEAAPKIQEPLEDAFSAARDAAELTQRLLALSRRQALKPNYIGLDKVVRNLKKFLRRILGEQFELHLNTPNDILTVFADPSRLENALLNLIINARDAMPRGGTLTIDIFRKTLPASDVGSSDLRPGSYAVMKITDTGTGMSQEVLSRAIEPFFTTKTSGKGTGLGLSMVYSFAKQSGGDLRLESKPEIGTSVSLLLPETEPVKEDSVMETQLGISQGSSETILIVEDEPRVRKLLTRRLRNFGYRVIECENAQSAKEIIESQADVDLLFSDIVMPGNMDGYELVGWVQEKRPELKLLLTTGADSRSGMRDESIPVLRKPYTEKMLQDTIRSLFDDKNKVTNLHDR